MALQSSNQWKWVILRVKWYGRQFTYCFPTRLLTATLQLVELSKAQDVEAGDGTTSVVVVAGALLSASSQLLEKGIHPSIIAESFLGAAQKAVEILRGMAIPVDLSNRESLIKCVITSLSSKVCSHNKISPPTLLTECFLFSWFLNIPTYLRQLQ